MWFLIRGDIQIRTFFPIVGNNADNVSATTPIIFLRCDPQHGKIIDVLGNNAEKHM
jgi:hypothetical protein